MQAAWSGKRWKILINLMPSMIADPLSGVTPVTTDSAQTAPAAAVVATKAAFVLLVSGPPASSNRPCSCGTR